MTLAELVGPAQVIDMLRVSSKPQLLHELSRRAAAALSIGQDAIQHALQQREDLGSTGLGKGFALPHARLADLAQPFALFARLARPIDFAAVDEHPVDLLVLLLTPADAAHEHLATLAAVSRPMRDGSFVRRLRAAQDASALYAVLSTA